MKSSRHSWVVSKKTGKAVSETTRRVAFEKYEKRAERASDSAAPWHQYERVITLQPGFCYFTTLLAPFRFGCVIWLWVCTLIPRKNVRLHQRCYSSCGSCTDMSSSPPKTTMGQIQVIYGPMFSGTLRIFLLASLLVEVWLAVVSLPSISFDSFKRIYKMELVHDTYR